MRAEYDRMTGCQLCWPQSLRNKPDRKETKLDSLWNVQDRTVALAYLTIVFMSCLWRDIQNYTFPTTMFLPLPYTATFMCCHFRSIKCCCHTVIRFVSTSAKFGIYTVVGMNPGHLLKIKCVHSRLNVNILASTSLPFRLTTVHVPNLALT